MLKMPVLETARLIIRPFSMEDLEAIHNLLDVELAEARLHTDQMKKLSEHREWLQWSVLNHTQLAKLYQPPYGDRAVILKSSAELIGACGHVPCLAPFEQLPGFAPSASGGAPAQFTTEFGLFYAISPAHQRRGYAREAAQALVDFAFQELHLKRVVATTDYDNISSIGVMRSLQMRILKNPLPEPAWFQVVGVLENKIQS